LHIEYGARSDPGRVRASNEDSFIANNKGAIFLVADGMGGHAAGEIASQIAASTVEEVVSARAIDSNMEELLRLAVQKANASVYETQKLKPECRGMGSTLTVLTFLNNHYFVAQVGDSRAYLYRNSTLSQLKKILLLAPSAPSRKSKLICKRVWRLKATYSCFVQTG